MFDAAATAASTLVGVIGITAIGSYVTGFVGGYASGLRRRNDAIDQLVEAVDQAVARVVATDEDLKAREDALFATPGDAARSAAAIEAEAHVFAVFITARFHDGGTWRIAVTPDHAYRLSCQLDDAQLIARRRLDDFGAELFVPVDHAGQMPETAETVDRIEALSSPAGESIRDGFETLGAAGAGVERAAALHPGRDLSALYDAHRYGGVDPQTARGEA